MMVKKPEYNQSMDIFSQAHFEFPYRYKFPGQASNETILFVTRENPVMLWVRFLSIGVVTAMLLSLGFFIGSFVQPILGIAVASIMQLVSLGAALLFLMVGGWWVSLLWRKSIVVVTTQRLIKFIYTTPVNRHNLSLPLEMIVDTGAYTKGFLQALFKLGTFTARSSAASSGVATDDAQEGRINKKYFYIENVAVAEDLQQYINKLLYAYRHYPDQIGNFRPFIPHLKGEARKEFMVQWPEYWS